jgi:glycosyltransferase involved in cell wall biosynthesis
LNSRQQLRIVALIVARNEEVHIARVLSALANQTLPIHQIILVDDGSIDETANIGTRLGCYVISLPFHKNNLVGTPELAERWNSGLTVVMQYSPDYVLLLGGDHVLPKNYIEEIIAKMNDNLVIASGSIEGEPYSENAPRGSGRIVNTAFWVQANQMKYPISYGWESWLVYKALQMGYTTKCFREIRTNIERQTSLRKSKLLGKAMYALGYDWKYAFGRCFLTFFKSPKAGVEMLWGWRVHQGVQRLDVADFVNDLQHKRFWRRVWAFLRKGGRK